MTLWRRHDGYVLRAFWGAFGAVLVFFTVMTVVVDLAERLRKLGRYWDRMREAGYEPLGALLRFYATLTPFVWLRVMPIAAAMGAAFALARLARHQELVPLVAAGVPSRRIVRPILLSGLVLAGLMVLARATVVPTLNRENQSLGRLLTKNKPDRIEQLPHVHDASGARLSAAAFMPLGRRLEDAFLVRYDAAEGPLELLRYPELVWDEGAEVWRAPRGGVRIPLDREAGGFVRFPIEPGVQAPLQASVELIEILCDADNSLGLSFAESAALVRNNPGSPTLILRHAEQLTLPASTLVLLALTLPFSLQLTRGRALPRMLAALAVVALYYAFGLVLARVAQGGSWNPVVLAWLPNVVFGSLGAALLAGMRS